MRNCFANAYEIELPSNLQISPIFNVSDIYPFKYSCFPIKEMISEAYGPFIDRQGQLTHKEQSHIDAILDKRVWKKTKDKEYFQYLVKWKDQTFEDVVWMT